MRRVLDEWRSVGQRRRRGCSSPAAPRRRRGRGVPPPPPHRTSRPRPPPRAHRGTSSRRRPAPGGPAAAARSAASVAAGRRRSSRAEPRVRPGRRDASIAPIRARAASTVTSFTWRTSSRSRSATYSCCPVTRPMPPTLGGDVPTIPVIAVRRRRSGSMLDPPSPALGSRCGDAGRRLADGGRREHRLDDLLVPGAATQVPGEPFLDLGT